MSNVAISFCLSRSTLTTESFHSHFSDTDSRQSISGCGCSHHWRPSDERNGTPELYRRGFHVGFKAAFEGSTEEKFYIHNHLREVSTYESQDRDCRKFRSTYFRPRNSMAMISSGNSTFSAGWVKISLFFPCFLFLTHIVGHSFTLADSLSTVDLSTVETRVLSLGQERKQDKLPLRGGGGACVYELVNLQESFSYEVKISYPATIPCCFSLSVVNEGRVRNVHSRRRLLNTEKVIFKVDRGNAGLITTDEMSFTALVLVTVEPEGVVSGAHVEEQEFVIYNIMLEEVRFGGIPMQAFWVGLLGVVAISISIIVAQNIPSLLEIEKDKLKAPKQALS